MLPVAKVVPLKDNKVIEVKVIDGKLSKQSKVRYNKDGSIDKRHSNKKMGKDSEVYAFNTVEEIKSMIDVFNKHINEASNENQKQIAHRNKMLFLIGINIGVRASDLRTLRYSFFLKDNGEFKEFYKLQPMKQRKQKKFVTLYFNQTVKKVISDYVNMYPMENLKDYLFKSRKGNEPISVGGLRRIIKETAKEANIEKNIGSHSLRKTWARHIWENAEDKNRALVMLQECLKHSDSMTTLRYIGILENEKKDMYESIDLGLDFI